MEELLKLLGFTTPLIYAGAAYGLFRWLDENASDEAKAALTRTMGFGGYKNEQVASALVEVFDRVYTHPLLRWPAFGRSLIFTIIVSAIWYFELPFRQYLLAQGNGGWLALGLSFNVFTDYLSLFVIRRLLMRSGTKPIIGLALGTVGAVAIVVAANLLRALAIAYVLCGRSVADCLRYPAPAMVLALMNSELKNPTFVWPALAVFVWLPLFALGILIVRLLTPTSWILGRAQWFLKEGKDHPLKAIGCVAAVVVFLGTVAGRAILSAV